MIFILISVESEQVYYFYQLKIIFFMKFVVHINKFFSLNLWSIGEKEFLV